jgi:hypothetical protein
VAFLGRCDIRDRPVSTPGAGRKRYGGAMLLFMPHSRIDPEAEVMHARRQLAENLDAIEAALRDPAFNREQIADQVNWLALEVRPR